MDKSLLTATEVGLMLGLAKSTIWRQVSKGNLPPPVKIGGATRWRVRDIQQLISKAA